MLLIVSYLQLSLALYYSEITKNFSPDGTFRQLMVSNDWYRVINDERFNGKEDYNE